MSLWFGEVLGIFTQEFKAQYGSQSGRSGGASAASNVDIDLELWGQHGDWASFNSQKRYMKMDVKDPLSVSLAAMNVSSSITLNADKDIVLDARDDMDDSHSTHFDDTIPSMDGIPVLDFHLAWIELHNGLFSHFHTLILSLKSTILFIL